MLNISFEEIKDKALELGYDDVGITSPVIPEEDKEAYLSWLGNGKHASMHYMENRVRCTPDSLLPGAKSALIFVSYYRQEPLPFTENQGLVASYARGRDYHNVHRSRLKKFSHWLKVRGGDTTETKGFSDSVPILEKALAVKAGLGWFGKNTLLIHRRFGTFTLLSGLLTTLDLPHSPKPNQQHAMRCGSCNKCISACPTQALEAPYQLNAARCLSYHLIESKEPLPAEIREKNPGYAFGCDICQDVCPHNVRKPPSGSLDFAPSSGVGAYLNLEGAQHLLDHPEKLHGTPLKRKGSPGLHQTLSDLVKS